jgi:hypothetical protein
MIHVIQRGADHRLGAVESHPIGAVRNNRIIILRSLF